MCEKSEREARWLGFHFPRNYFDIIIFVNWNFNLKVELMNHSRKVYIFPQSDFLATPLQEALVRK